LPSVVNTHHDQLRFAWDLVNPEGTVVVAGIDIGALASDGRARFPPHRETLQNDPVLSTESVLASATLPRIG